MALLSDVKAEAVKIEKTKFMDRFDSVVNLFDLSHQRAIRYTRDSTMSSWLTSGKVTL